MVVLASTLALVLGIFRPDLPATVLGFPRRVPAGLVAGRLTFVDTHPAAVAERIAVPAKEEAA